MLDDERFAVDPDVDLITPAIPSLDDDRILALELVRATEAGAIAAARFLGRGDDDEVDGAATDAMRPMLGTIPMRGVVAIGAGLVGASTCHKRRSNRVGSLRLWQVGVELGDRAGGVAEP